MSTARKCTVTRRIRGKAAPVERQWDDRVGMALMIAVWFIMGVCGLGVKCGLL